MFTEILQRFLILQTLVGVALCCWCRRATVLQSFCNHEFAVMVEIGEITNTAPPLSYRANVIYSFKGNIHGLKLKEKTSLILNMHPYCSIYNLKPGAIFLIFGMNRDGRMRTGRCSGSMPWSSTSPEVRVGLETYYTERCKDIEYSDYPWPESYMKLI